MRHRADSAHSSDQVREGDEKYDSGLDDGQDVESVVADQGAAGVIPVPSPSPITITNPLLTCSGQGAGSVVSDQVAAGVIPVPQPASPTIANSPVAGGDPGTAGVIPVLPPLPATITNPPQTYDGQGQGVGSVVPDPTAEDTGPHPEPRTAAIAN